MKHEDQMRALIDAYIELGKRADFSDSQIIDSLADIFDQEELEWLGYGEYVKSYFEDAPEGYTWITVHKDALGYEDDYDNLTEILVPTVWLHDILKAEGEDIEAWFDEYTADNTDAIARRAWEENQILECRDEAVQYMLEKEHEQKEKVFLVSNEDRTWSAVVSKKKPEGLSAELAVEKDYPAQLIYYRTDINGSTVMEQDTCTDRAALLESLNWVGQCGYPLLQLWDYNAGLPIRNDLSIVIERTASLRYEKEQIAAVDFYENTKLDEPETVKPYITWSFPVGNGLLALIERKGPGEYDFNLWEDEDGKRGKFYNGGVLTRKGNINSLADAVAWVFETYPNFELQDAYTNAKKPLAQQIREAASQQTAQKNTPREAKKDRSTER